MRHGSSSAKPHSFHCSFLAIIRQHTMLLTVQTKTGKRFVFRLNQCRKWWDHYQTNPIDLTIGNVYISKDDILKAWVHEPSDTGALSF